MATQPEFFPLPDVIPPQVPPEAPAVPAPEEDPFLSLLKFFPICPTKIFPIAKTCRWSIS